MEKQEKQNIQTQEVKIKPQNKFLLFIKKYKFIIIAFVLVFLFFGVGLLSLSIRQRSGGPGGPPSSGGWGQRPSGVEEIKTQVSEKVPNPPTDKISIYKGFWMPCHFIGGNCQSMDDPKLLKEVGANIVGLAPNIKINSKGEVSFFPMDFVEERLAYFTNRYYPEGIRIFISPELDFTEDLNSRGMGEPRPIPTDVAAKEGFLDKYDVIIEDLAKLSEKYKVEMFSPMNEPDMKLGILVSSNWSQRILPKIKKNYNGKVLWKVGMAAPESGLINFNGYDVLGVDFTAPGGDEAQAVSNYPNIVAKIFDDALSWAKRDSVAEVLTTEFGIWGGAIKFSEDGKVATHRIVFEQGKGKINGFIVLDPPSDLNDRPLKGSKTLEEIKVWFQQL